jgi:uncharacterized protein (TIGR02246 family)
MMVHTRINEPMRSISALLVSTIVAGHFASAQTRGAQLYTASREQLDVTKIVLAQENAWNKGDLETYLSYYKDAPDTEAILNGPVRGFDAIRNAMRQSFPNRDAMGSLEQSSVEVRELGPDHALAIGHYKLIRSRKNGGEAEGNFTEIFEKTEAGWKLVFSENT